MEEVRCYKGMRVIAPVLQQTFTGRRTAAWNEPNTTLILDREMAGRSKNLSPISSQTLAGRMFLALTANLPNLKALNIVGLNASLCSRLCRVLPK